MNGKLLLIAAVILATTIACTPAHHAPPAARAPTPVAVHTPAPTPTWISQDELHRITTESERCTGPSIANRLQNGLRTRRITPQQAREITIIACQPTPTLPHYLHTPPPAPTRTPTRVPDPTEPMPPKRNPTAEAPKPTVTVEKTNRKGKPRTPEVRRQLSILRYHNPELASRVEKMPFLETRDLRDALDIRSLAYTSSLDPEAAVQQLEHQELRNGIKDQHTTMVALLHADFMFHQGLADKILDASTLRTATEKTILPLGGETRITVARLESEPNAEILQAAEEILTKMEKYLDAPLKVRHVIIMLGAPTPGNSGGANTQTSITLPARFQRDRERLLHELAHYFWNDNQPWIDEGMAELLSQMADRDFTEEPVPLASPACRSSITDLEQGRSQQCVYAVGERFFSKLRENMGHKPFQQGVRKLQKEAWKTGRPLDLDDVQDAFQPINPDAFQDALDNWG